MTTRFLAAAYNRRQAPKQYDPDYLNVELARLAKAMTSYVIRNVTANTSLQSNDGMLVCNATGGNISVTLGLAARASGQPTTIKKSDATANTITIIGTVDGVVNPTLVNQNDSIIVQSDGTNWFRPTLTATGPTGGTAFSLTAGTHLSGGPFNGTAAVTLTTDATAANVFSTIVARDASGGFSAGAVNVTSIVAIAGGGTGTNLLEFSQQFGAAAWTPTAITVVEDAIAAPDTTVTADKLTGTGTDANVAQGLTSPTTTRYTMSVYLKWSNTITSEFGVYNATTAGWLLRVQVLWDGAGNVTGVGAIGGAGGSFVSTSVGSGWWRCSGVSTGAPTIGDSLAFVVYPVGAGIASAGKIVYAWGAQLEAGTTLTAYSVTTAIQTAAAFTGKFYVTGATAIAGSLTVSSTLGVTGVATFTAKPIMSSLTASLPVFSDASKGLVSNPMTGTGNVVMSASPTMTGTTTVGGLTYSTALGSLTPYATPAAFTQTLSSQFASTVSGATLMGYGTSGDATLKNRAGTDVLRVVSNTTDVYIAGNLVGGIIPPFLLMGA